METLKRQATVLAMRDVPLGATMPNLNKGIVGDIRVPLPPQSVMEKYAKIRDQLVCAKQNNIAFSKYNFFESLSQKAFLGGL